jgi:hypothetical protein
MVGLWAGGLRSILSITVWIAKRNGEVKVEKLEDVVLNQGQQSE